MKNVYLLLIFLSFNLIVFSQTQWVQTKGPEWGTINSIQKLNGNLFIGTNSGVFKSSNEGVLWSKVDIGFPYLNVSYLINDNSILYASTSGQGILISTDNGVNWNQSNSGLTDLNVNFLYLNGSSFYACTNSGPFVSTDNCLNWSAINSGISTVSCRSFLSFNGKLFAGATDGLHISSDNGATWNPSNTGINSLDLNVISIIDAGSNLILIGGDNGYLSTDGGTNWNPINAITNEHLLVKNGSKIFSLGGSLQSSSDDGATWDFVSNPPDFNYSFYDDGTNYYFGTYSDGIYKSSDNGINFTKINNGIYSSYLYNSYVDGNKIYVIESGNLNADSKARIHATTNFGETYQEKTAINSGLNLFTQDLFCLNSSGSRLIAGTGNGIYLSDDEGLNWYASSSGLKNILSDYVSVQSILNLGNNSILVSTHSFPPNTGNGVYLSTNNGISWNSSNTGGLNNLNVFCLAAQGSTILAGTKNDAVFISTDNGVNWTQKGNGISKIPFLGYDDIYSVGFVGNNLLAGSNNGLYISTDNGNNWNKVSGSPSSLNVTSFCNFGTDIYAATNQGVFVSSDSGVSWTDFNLNLACLNVSSLSSDNQFLYATTIGTGTWRYPLIANANVKELSKNQTNFEIFPNPAKQSTTIRVNSELSNLKIKLFSIYGQEIISLNHTGEKEINILTEKLSSGVYLIKLYQSDRIIESKKLIITN